MAVDKIDQLIEQYHKISKASSKWLFDLAMPVFRDILTKSKFEDRGRLEISSFGIKDMDLQVLFEQLADSTITMEQILGDDEANQKLSFYFNKICKTPPDLRHFIAEREQSDIMLFTSPVPVVTQDHHNEPREVLYLMRPRRNKTEIIGIAYDDSLTGDLTFKSAMHVSRLAGGRI